MRRRSGGRLVIYLLNNRLAFRKEGKLCDFNEEGAWSEVHNKNSYEVRERMSDEEDEDYDDEEEEEEEEDDDDENEGGDEDVGE